MNDKEFYEYCWARYLEEDSADGLGDAWEGFVDYVNSHTPWDTLEACDRTHGYCFSGEKLIHRMFIDYMEFEVHGRATNLFEGYTRSTEGVWMEVKE